jgi:hypothetical protein
MSRKPNSEDVTKKEDKDEETIVAPEKFAPEEEAACKR